MESKALTSTQIRIISSYLGALIVCMIVVQFMPQLDFIAAWQEPTARTTVCFLQFFSDSISYFSFGIPIAIVVAMESDAETNKKKNRISFLYIVLSIAVAGLISWLIKKTFTEPRPYEVDLQILQLSDGGGYSLPSGHTTEAFASTMAVTLLLRNWLISVPMFCWALLVALSRIYLGVHYPFDIFVGMLIGSTVSFIFYRYIFQKYLIN